MSGEFEGQMITKEVAAQYAIYAMLSSNCYHKKKREIFKVEKLGWTLLKTNKRFFGGLAYDIYQHSPTENLVWAFRGSDGMMDFINANFSFLPSLFGNQYRLANEDFSQFLADNDASEVSVCGHSLGGGLALSMSVRHGVPAITFDTSPRVFDGLGNHHQSATRIIIYESGEILQKIRAHYPKIKEVVSEECVYRCDFNFPGSQHRIDELAKGLLKLGSQSDLGLTQLA